MSNVTVTSLQALKQAGEKFAVITAYDATFAQQAEQAGIEVVLVGDSLGNVLQGHDNTLPVTLEDMAYHTRCVSRGCQGPLIIGDLPFGSYATTAQTLDSAAVLMRAGAHMVKLEGGEWLLDSIRALTERGIPVCAHLGLTPQSVNAFGGFRVQGREDAQAAAIIEDARRVEAAGASLLVLECVPRSLGEAVTAALSIPVIGIGAGPETDAQVLVMHDMLGLSARPPRFVRNFLEDRGSVLEALIAYRRAVKEGEFPADEHCFN